MHTSWRVLRFFWAPKYFLQAESLETTMCEGLQQSTTLPPGKGSAQPVWRADLIRCRCHQFDQCNQCTSSEHSKRWSGEPLKSCNVNWLPLTCNVLCSGVITVEESLDGGGCQQQHNVFPASGNCPYPGLNLEQALANQPASRPRRGSVRQRMTQNDTVATTPSQSLVMSDDIWRHWAAQIETGPNPLTQWCFSWHLLVW